MYSHWKSNLNGTAHHPSGKPKIKPCTAVTTRYGGGFCDATNGTGWLSSSSKNITSHVKFLSVLFFFQQLSCIGMTCCSDACQNFASWIFLWCYGLLLLGYVVCGSGVALAWRVMESSRIVLYRRHGELLWLNVKPQSLLVVLSVIRTIVFSSKQMMSLIQVWILLLTLFRAVPRGQLVGVGSDSETMKSGPWLSESLSTYTRHHGASQSAGGYYLYLCTRCLELWFREKRPRLRVTSHVRPERFYFVQTDVTYIR